MLSLTFFIAAFALSLAVSAAAVAWAARAVGSPRGRWAVGLVAVLKVAGIGLTLAALSALYPSSLSLGMRLAADAVVMVLQLCVAWVVFRRAFALSRPRTWAPFGAHVATQVVLVVLLLLLFRPFLAEAFVIPTMGMEPALAAGDRFVVNKRLGDPRRWDIVAYYTPNSRYGPPPGGVPEKWCKHIVGLPGDRLRFEADALYVNDQPATPPMPIIGTYALAGGRPGFGLYDAGETLQLGPDEYFMIGDHVARSGDSRHHGPVKRSAIIGVADLRYWPVKRMAVIR